MADRDKRNWMLSTNIQCRDGNISRAINTSCIHNSRPSLQRQQQHSVESNLFAVTVLLYNPASPIPSCHSQRNVQGLGISSYVPGSVCILNWIGWNALLILPLMDQMKIPHTMMLLRYYYYNTIINNASTRPIHQMHIWSRFNAIYYRFCIKIIAFLLYLLLSYKNLYNSKNRQFVHYRVLYNSRHGVSGN